MLSILVLLVLLATGAGTVQGHHPQRADWLIRHEIRACYAATVLPVLRQQRQQLEAQLSPVDRPQLATCRTQLLDLPAGTYFYQITAKGSRETRRFVKE